jgi:hypothetical protein
MQFTQYTELNKHFDYIVKKNNALTDYSHFDSTRFSISEVANCFSLLRIFSAGSNLTKNDDGKCAEKFEEVNDKEIFFLQSKHGSIDPAICLYVFENINPRAD